MRRRSASETPVATLEAPAAEPQGADPAPVDADAASQSELIESVAAAVVGTVIAATIEPTLPPRAAAAAPAEQTPDAAASDALDVTVVDEQRRADDVAVILQSADGAVATTPVTLPTSPITLPVSRRSRRRPQASVILDSTADEAVAEPVVAAAEPAAARASKPLEQAAIEQPVAAAAFPADDTVADEFATAARLFSFTGETPTQQAAPVAPAPEPVSEGLPAAAAPRTRRNVRRIAATSFSVGVMGVVGLLTVGMTMPVSAIASASGTDSITAPVADTATTRLAVGGDVASSDGAIQAYVAPAQSQAAVVDRADGYSATTYSKMAVDSGIKYPTNFYVNNPTSPIQWPFAVGVSISYGFGMRDGGFHEGADFVPGEGAPVQAIADGTVRIATEQGGAFGVTVLIDHVIDGQLVSSRYGHMQYGSLQVTPGEKVHVGQFLGRTGNTGRSFGAHTHVEILQNGTTPIDPIAWLRQHAGG
ncbi:murein DD-endopeptidase MepM/ murein hydrolase activator NlpD [Microbacterium testaceum]|uniref:M23 family metallopeptidase n=1 Tax=Microbacterium TaxID=33882 RepID=UPI00277EF960|nr:MULTISPECIES: M23 family metallopeptidase [Microbacterium]MDQ1112494.1 murein DD-endopeptidase MepM/ murein hydrolase activator NlpD [Microbacterium testaceum]MDR6096968.1 murein DD-endopeptidase MepM/ murein hydrolase activator NlpD [Microbacterium sp. SORGH_AS_0454]